MFVTRDRLCENVKELVDGVWGGKGENAFIGGSWVDQAGYMKPCDVLHVNIVDCSSISRRLSCTNKERRSRTALDVFDRVDIAVQNLERDPRGRRVALVSNAQWTSVDSAR